MTGRATSPAVIGPQAYEAVIRQMMAVSGQTYEEVASGLGHLMAVYRQPQPEIEIYPATLVRCAQAASTPC